MSESGESIVAQYLVGRGFEVRHITETSMYKTPDKAVYKDGVLAFYLAEKTIDYDDFEGFKVDNTYSKLVRLAKNATKQLQAVNHNHDVPNVIAFVNMDKDMKDSRDLFIALTGCAKKDQDEWLKIYEPRKEVKSSLDYVDMFLWFNGQEFENRFLGRNEQFNQQLLELFVDEEQD